MHSIQHRWDTGALLAYDATDNELAAFVARTGAKRAVGLQWQHAGQSHEVEGFASLLPNRTGLVIGGADNGQPHELQVLNADGSLRFVLRDQLAAEVQRHGSVRLQLPREGWPASGISFGVVASFADEPALPVMLDIDWLSGQLLRSLPCPRFF